MELWRLYIKWITYDSLNACLAPLYAWKAPALNIAQHSRENDFQIVCESHDFALFRKPEQI